MMHNIRDEESGCEHLHQGNPAMWFFLPVQHLVLRGSHWHCVKYCWIMIWYWKKIKISEVLPHRWKNMDSDA